MVMTMALTIIEIFQHISVRRQADTNPPRDVSMLFCPIPPRRAQEEPEPEPEPEPEDDLSQERPVSEDSISTHELVYGNEFRSTSRGDEGCRMTRCAYKSPSCVERVLLW